MPLTYPFLKQITAFLKNLFFPPTIIEWNKLDINLRNSRSLLFLRNTSRSSYDHPQILCLMRKV